MNDLGFAVVCLLMGSFVLVLGVALVVGLFAARTADHDLLGYILYAFIMLSFAGFLLSLGGFGVALAAKQAALAYALDGAATVTGLAIFAGVVMICLYGLVRYVTRRKPDTASH